MAGLLKQMVLIKVKVKLYAKVSTNEVEICRNENSCISLSKGVNVKETDATFGMKIDSSSQTIATVILNKEEARMNIKRNGIIKIGTSSDKEQQSIKTNDVLVSNQEETSIQPCTKSSSLELNTMNIK